MKSLKDTKSSHKTTAAESFEVAILLALGDTLIYFGVTIVFIMDGWLGTLATKVYGTKAVGFVALVLIVVLILIYKENKRKFKWEE